MSIPVVILIMLAAGVFGGIVSFLLPANESSDTGKKLKPWWQCVILGIGATVLVPLFLEFAQSKLLDNGYFAWSWKNPDVPAATVLTKDYLLYAAYCLLAASAGFKFINMLINNVVKEEQFNKLKTEKEELEKQSIKRIKNNQSESLKAEENILKKVPVSRGIESASDNEKLRSVIAGLPPIKDPNDPQKGRFGGKPERNGRRLSASVKASAVPGFYNVTLQVESTDPQKPLDAPVIFYIHDSFTPSVYTVRPDEFENGVAVDDEVLSYGAFTVGVIADNGDTLLELDLSEDSKFPKEFRMR
ncbi:YEATS-associated helix-containing protein [Chitinophaga sp.]|uniref:YEATS-associated helix-containing protein n=1 Tax=Chitinophaga sp. TaxID=1869181 RepID=UPI0031E36AEA